MDADGDFIVSWQSNSDKDDGDDSKNGIFGRIYSGNIESDEFLVNTETESEQTTRLRPVRQQRHGSIYGAALVAHG